MPTVLQAPAPSGVPCNLLGGVSYSVNCWLPVLQKTLQASRCLPLNNERLGLSVTNSWPSYLACPALRVSRTALTAAPRAKPLFLQTSPLL